MPETDPALPPPPRAPPAHAAPPRAQPPSRLLRLAPLLFALLLAVLTTAARQWELLLNNLPVRPWSVQRGLPLAHGALRFSPAGNEWRFRRWSAFGADEIELRRTFTVNDTVPPIADAHATFPEARIHRDLVAAPPTGRSALTWSARRWGWPMRHAQIDHTGRRSWIPLGFAVNTAVFTPAWFIIIHAVRIPVAAVSRRLSIPAHACRSCRYDLRGLPDDAPCPECGRRRRA